MQNAHDDEGIIDLGALSVPPRHGANATDAVFSFASEPPPPPSSMRGTLPSLPALSAKRRTIGLAAAGVCLVVLGAIGVGFAFRGEQAVTPPVVLTNALVAPRAPAAAAPAPAPTSAPAAAASASSDDDDDSGSDPKPKKARGHKGHGGAGVSRSAASSPKPPKVSKPSDPCHCKGDFQCTIHCAANFKK